MFTNDERTKWNKNRTCPSLYYESETIIRFLIISQKKIKKEFIQGKVNRSEMQSNLTCKKMVARHLSTNIVLLVNETRNSSDNLYTNGKYTIDFSPFTYLESNKEEFSAWSYLGRRFIVHERHILLFSLIVKQIIFFVFKIIINFSSISFNFLVNDCSVK